MHTAIIVTGFGQEELNAAFSAALDIFGVERLSGYIHSEMNGHCSFMIAPSGGKEGLATDELHRAKIKDFLGYLGAMHSLNLEWVKVTYGKGGTPDVISNT